MLKNKLLTLLQVSIMGLLLLGSTHLAAKQGHIKLTSQAEKIITVKDEQGNSVNKLIPAVKVLPGEIVQYTNTFENTSSERADNIGITNPIPEHTVYVPNTATGDNFIITYSVNGGNSWGTATTLKVKGSDGEMYQAKPKDYTHIRWQYGKSLNPAEKKSVSYRVRLL